MNTDKLIFFGLGIILLILMIVVFYQDIKITNEEKGKVLSFCKSHDYPDVSRVTSNFNFDAETFYYCERIINNYLERIKVVKCGDGRYCFVNDRT